MLLRGTRNASLCLYEVYLYRGSLRDRPVIPGGDWRAFGAAPDSVRAAGVRRVRDPKTRGPLLWEASRKTIAPPSESESVRSHA